MADITMPQLGETVTEGTITKWFKQVGDQIAEDEPLFEVSTDKVDSEVPAPTSGYLAEILVPEGETVDVGVRLAVISDSPPSGGGGGGEAQAPAQEEAAAPAQEQAEPAGPSGAAQAPPAPVAEERGPATEEAAPAPAQGAVEEEAREAEAPQPQAQPEQAQPEQAQPAVSGDGDGDGGGGKVLSPVVRRLISEHNLDPAAITGTGAGGRITRNDVLAVVEGRAPQPQPGAAPAERVPSPGPAPAPAPAAAAPAAEAAPAPTPAQAPPPAAAAPAAEAAPAPTPAQAPPPASAPPAAQAPRPAPAPATAAVAPGERDEVIPFTNIRRRTAEHMVRSKATSAHTLTAIEVDYDRVDRVRRAYKDDFKAEHGVSLTYLPFIARATIDAMAEFPNINSSVGEEALIVHRDIHLGIAVDLDLQGLIVPVVRNAADKRLPAIAREIADLAGRARSKKLGADEIAGGTFTITNPGPYGTFLTSPIINQPQVAILSTDGIKKRPVVVELPDGSDGIAIHPTGNLALTFDHRVIDGAYASAFIAAIKEILETRDWEQEL